MNTIPIPEGMETKLFVMSSGALGDVPEVLRQCFPGKHPWIIADGNTWKAAGKTVSAYLEKAGFSMLPPHLFPGEPRLHPDHAHSLFLASKMNPDLVPLAVGSGVINDLVKRASGIAEIPYCCIATAASVDGYTSYGAALSVDGFKKTMQCPAPYALIADLEVLKTAPSEMLASGYADLLTKVPAGADWCIADQLGIEPVNAPVWEMVQSHLREWIADPENLNHIFMGLAATGYSMQMYRDSRPASGAEHLMSHIWEMEGLQCHGQEVSHGFKVGIGTLASVRLMNFLVETDVESARKMATRICTRKEREEEIGSLLARGCYGDGIREVALAKFCDGSAAEERRELIWKNWENLRTRVKNQLLPEKEFIRLLKQAKAPVHEEEIGLDRTQYLHGVRTAQLIRKRYTILDLLFESGLLNTAMRQALG